MCRVRIGGRSYIRGPCGQAGYSSSAAQTGVSRPHSSKFSLHLRWRRSIGGNGLASTCLQELALAHPAGCIRHVARWQKINAKLWVWTFVTAVTYQWAEPSGARLQVSDSLSFCYSTFSYGTIFVPIVKLGYVSISYICCDRQVHPADAWTANNPGALLGLQYMLRYVAVCRRC